MVISDLGQPPPSAVCLRLDAGIKRIGSTGYDHAPGRFWMEGVEQDIGGFRDDGTRNRKEGVGVALQPLSTEVASDIWALLPVLRKSGVLDSKYGQIVRH